MKKSKDDHCMNIIRKTRLKLIKTIFELANGNVNVTKRDFSETLLKQKNEQKNKVNGV